MKSLEELKTEVNNILENTKASRPITKLLKDSKAAGVLSNNLGAINKLEAAVKNTNLDLHFFLLIVHQTHCDVKDYSSGAVFGFLKGSLDADLNNFFRKTLGLTTYDKTDSKTAMELITQYCKKYDLYQNDPLNRPVDAPLSTIDKSMSEFF